MKALISLVPITKTLTNHKMKIILKLKKNKAIIILISNLQTVITMVLYLHLDEFDSENN